MITHLEGVLRTANPTGAVIDVGGVGYEVAIPLSTFDRLPRVGCRVTVLTHLHLREDGATLYGFMTAEERSLFRMLIGVSGIGPKIAVGILSGISPQFRTPSSRGPLLHCPRHRPEKAERLIVELKDRIAALEFEGDEGRRLRPRRERRGPGARLARLFAA